MFFPQEYVYVFAFHLNCISSIFALLVEGELSLRGYARAHIFTYTYFHGIVEITEILSTLLDRHPDGVLEMLLFNRLGGGKFSENATPLSKIDESSKSLK